MDPCLFVEFFYCYVFHFDNACYHVYVVSIRVKAFSFILLSCDFFRYSVLIWMSCIWLYGRNRFSILNKINKLFKLLLYWNLVITSILFRIRSESVSGFLFRLSDFFPELILGHLYSSLVVTEYMMYCTFILVIFFYYYIVTCLRLLLSTKTFLPRIKR